MKGEKGFQIGNKTGYKHGMSKARIYRIWVGMKNRTCNKFDERYYDYGQRGINLCEEWKSFVVFKEWALSCGYKQGLTIDRIDNERGYCPDNCRWITREMNSKNRRILLMTGIRKHGLG